MREEEKESENLPENHSRQLHVLYSTSLPPFLLLTLLHDTVVLLLLLMMIMVLVAVAEVAAK